MGIKDELEAYRLINDNSDSVQVMAFGILLVAAIRIVANRKGRV